MKKYLLFPVMALFLLSCSSDDNPEQSGPELIGKTFVHRFFETEQQCIEAQPDPNFYINCYEEISFTDDVTAQVMLTDIQYAVSYTIDGNNIIVSFSPNATITFERVNNATLKRLDDNTIWKERTGNSIWD